jgi:hypothetical protein
MAKRGQIGLVLYGYLGLVLCGPYIRPRQSKSPHTPVGYPRALSHRPTPKAHPRAIGPPYARSVGLEGKAPYTLHVGFPYGYQYPGYRQWLPPSPFLTPTPFLYPFPPDPSYNSHQVAQLN